MDAFHSEIGFELVFPDVGFHMDPFHREYVFVCFFEREAVGTMWGEIGQIGNVSRLCVCLCVAGARRPLCFKSNSYLMLFR